MIRKVSIYNQLRLKFQNPKKSISEYMLFKELHLHKLKKEIKEIKLLKERNRILNFLALGLFLFHFNLFYASKFIEKKYLISALFLFFFFCFYKLLTYQIVIIYKSGGCSKFKVLSSEKEEVLTLMKKVNKS